MRTGNIKGKQIGNVTCDVVLKGVKDGNNFSRTYHLKLAVSYQNEVVSIYEIGNITWNSLRSCQLGYKQ